MKKTILREQVIPVSLTVATFIVLCVMVYGVILLLNLLPIKEKIVTQLRIQDILVGLTIYLKTSIDFAIFIGNLMKNNPGWKNRIVIETGTALGNALGTIVILLIWNFFREVPLLMVLMIFIASLVLLSMAEESLEELFEKSQKNPSLLQRIASPILFVLTKVNAIFRPLLHKVLPNTSRKQRGTLSFINLLFFSASIPFILGLDDFAGYIPLFSVVNVFGFSVGVFLGHMILNAALFVSPNKTTEMVRNPWILLFGGIAFIGIAAWGFYESGHIFLSLFH